MTQILMESILSIIDRIGLEPINTVYEQGLKKLNKKLKKSLINN